MKSFVKFPKTQAEADEIARYCEEKYNVKCFIKVKNVRRGMS